MQLTKTQAPHSRRTGYSRLLATLLCAALVPQASLAQDANEVTLRFASGQESLDGTLVEFKDDKFLIESKLGLLAIPNIGVVCIGAACPEGTTPQIDDARIVLTSLDGSVTIEGDLIEVRNNTYFIATAVGEQLVSIDAVNCVGEACVEPTALSTAPASKQVELFNGEITLAGELVDIEDGSYILNEQTMGEIRVSMADFDCSGPGCPE